MVQTIERWSDFKLVLRQLDKAEAKQKFATICIDTIGIAYDTCEKFVCAQAGVQKIGDIPYGGGYSALSKEFESSLRQITMMGYGLIMTCHLREVQDADGRPSARSQTLIIVALRQLMGQSILSELLPRLGTKKVNPSVGFKLAQLLRLWPVVDLNIWRRALSLDMMSSLRRLRKLSKKKSVTVRLQSKNPLEIRMKKKKYILMIRNQNIHQMMK